MSGVTLESTFEELNTPDKWAEWLSLCWEVDPWLVDYWKDMEGCHGCQHFDGVGGWCRRMDRRANVNPVLRELGMACMGMGREEGNANLS